ncbi:helix-turn-helix transcriptional regulator [Streptomyces sp. NPDC005435]|uniref:helix-turn-helix domain-containing protein n=1 Tax=Streptomyces sp. NPDC005435 TaxID=3154464 RepID=UPI0034531E33
MSAPAGRSVSGAVRKALGEQGKSLRSAAKELHYDVACLSRVLNGKQAPSPELTQALNEFLGLSLEVESASHHDDEMDAWELARRVQTSDTSAMIQATAQEGRAHARLGNASDTYAAIDRVQSMSAAMGSPDTPEHHYRYDPAKSLSYTATTLAWLGDSAAEPYAREVIRRLGPGDDVSTWPRRMASANLDLALVLLKENRLDEACDSARKALLSGRAAPSRRRDCRPPITPVHRGGGHPSSR